MHTLGGLDNHRLMTEGYTLYDWSLPITREDAIVHHSHKIYPTVTSREGEGSFPCWDWLCHEIERDSPRSHFPRLTFVGDSGHLFLTSVQDYTRIMDIHQGTYIKCHFVNWSSDIIMSLLTVLCHTQVIMCCCAYVLVNKNALSIKHAVV